MSVVFKDLLFSMFYSVVIFGLNHIICLVEICMQRFWTVENTEINSLILKNAGHFFTSAASGKTASQEEPYSI
jgi:hypothetical protein